MHLSKIHQNRYKRHDIISTFFKHVYSIIHRIKHLLPLGGGILNDGFSSTLPKFPKMSTYYVYN